MKRGDLIQIKRSPVYFDQPVSVHFCPEAGMVTNDTVRCDVVGIGMILDITLLPIENGIIKPQPWYKVFFASAGIGWIHGLSFEVL